jgi:hypothetical protein
MILPRWLPSGKEIAVDTDLAQHRPRPSERPPQADGCYGEPTAWLQTSFDEYNASFSPDEEAMTRGEE